jgi:thioester reductase-like protein
MQINVGDTNMGLCEADWSTLATKVDTIIHNAWKVDFNHKLPSFKNRLHGLKDILSLTTNPHTKRPHVFFVSSLSTVGNWLNLCKDINQVPEIVPRDYNFALSMGYAESKLVAERMIAEAVAITGAKATILRVGQLAGPLSENGGEWHRTEWLPTLVKTSKALGCLPDSMNMIDWVPVDKLSQIISEIVQHECNKSASSLVYNLVNPRLGKWDDLVTEIQEAWTPAMTRAVPFQDWLKMLKDQAADLEKFPALRLPEFYQGLAADAEFCKERQVVYAADQGTEASPTMRQLQPIDRGAMRTWLNQWKF